MKRRLILIFGLVLVVVMNESVGASRVVEIFPTFPNECNISKVLYQDNPIVYTHSINTHLLISGPHTDANLSLNIDWIKYALDVGNTDFGFEDAIGSLKIDSVDDSLSGMYRGFVTDGHIINIAGKDFVYINLKFVNEDNGIVLIGVLKLDLMYNNDEFGGCYVMEGYLLIDDDKQIRTQLSLFESFLQTFEDWKETLTDTIETLQTLVTTILPTLTNHTTTINDHENRIETLESSFNDYGNCLGYLKYLSNSDRKNMVCGYATEKNMTNIIDLGYNCKLEYKYYSSGRRRVTCRCKEIKS